MGSQSLATLEQSTWLDLLWFSLVGDARGHLSLPALPSAPVRSLLPHSPLCSHQVPTFSMSCRSSLLRPSRAQVLCAGITAVQMHLPSGAWAEV